MAAEKKVVNTYSKPPVPQLKAGKYKLSAKSTLKPDDGNTITEEKTMEFGLFSPRFSLEDKHFMSPPAAASAHFPNNTLPKLVIKNPLLPYARSPYAKPASKNNSPFLILLSLPASAFQNSGASFPNFLPPVTYLLKELEGQAGAFITKKVAPKTLFERSKEDLAFFGIDASKITQPLNLHLPLQERWKAPTALQTDDKKKTQDPEAENLPVDCLLIKKTEIVKWLPKAHQLEQLIYTHQEDDDDEQTVIISRNVIQEQGDYRCFLLSLEHRYDQSSGQVQLPPSAQANDYLGFVILKHWQFESKGPKTDSAYLKEQLANIQLNEFTATSNLLKHNLRNGENDHSYYTFPFWPIKQKPPLLKAPFQKERIAQSDELVVIRNDQYDITYASAWELGRLIGLDMRTLIKTLLAYKQAEDDSDHKASLKSQIQSLFQPYDVFNRIPLHYLLPSDWQPIGPQLSLFKFDPWWFIQLLKGLFSLGDDIVIENKPVDRPQSSFFELFPKWQSLIPEKSTHKKELYGFVLRSGLLADLPELAYEPYFESGSTFKLAARRDIDKQTAIFLFESPRIEKINVRVPSSHYGHMLPGSDSIIKDKTGKDSDHKLDYKIDLKGRIELDRLKTQLSKVFGQDAAHGKSLALQIQAKEPDYRLSVKA